MDRQERYFTKGIAGLRHDGPRPERKPPLSAEAIKQVVGKTLHQKPGHTGASARWLLPRASDPPTSSILRIYGGLAVRGPKKLDNK